MTDTPVTPQQMDAIREVVNIGAGHAATEPLGPDRADRDDLRPPHPVGERADDRRPTRSPGDGELVVISVPIMG
jgi:chemotaxis protein CheC